MKILFLIFGILFVVDQPSFAQNDTGLDRSKKLLADDLSNLYRVIYSEYRKQVSNLLAQSVYVTKPSGAIHSEADKDSQVLKQITPGETFELLEEADAWYKVQGSNPYSGEKITGWISREQASPTLNILPNSQLMSKLRLMTFYGQLPKII